MTTAILAQNPLFVKQHLMMDYCTEKGLSFETAKVALQAEVDKVK